MQIKHLGQNPECYLEVVPGAVGCFHSCWLGCLPGLQGSDAVSWEQGASPGMFFDQKPTDGMVDMRELNYGSLSQTVQTEIPQVQFFFGKRWFWQNAFLKSIFPAIQVSLENVYHPFLFQNNLPIKVIHTCYLIEGNGCTSPRQHTHRLSLIAIVSCVLLVIN